MVNSIHALDVGNKDIIKISKPTPIYDQGGQPVSKDGMPVFYVKTTGWDINIGKTTPIKEYFFDRYLIDNEHHATRGQLTVFTYLAQTTSWSEALVLVDQAGAPLLTQSGKGQLKLVKHGNRTATRSIEKIAQDTGISKGAVQKALRFWELEETIKPIRTHEGQTREKMTTQSGRPKRFVRYEIDPAFVWNGPICVGNGYTSALWPLGIVTTGI